MKTILFPTDFSDNAFHSAQYAAMLAKRFDAKLLLLNVYSVILPIVSESPMIFDKDDIVVRRQNDAEQSLQVFADKLMEETKLPTEQIVQLVEYGLLTDVIADTAKGMNVDLIVMGTHGASYMIDRWFGTNAEKVVESSNCPVWVVPENTPLNMPKVIMYAADFKEDEVTATYEVLALAQPLGATCKVIHVHDYFELNANQTVKQEVAELKEEFQNFDISIKDINREEIVKGLETYVRTHKPDVLAMAVYEKSFFSKLFNSSLTEHFVQEAKLPMLFFKKPVYS
ncbi:universal stress protein UspA [Emticicia aquatilis]|uniref:Universal stress protein UspA n=1 Tax=Emticicia aquatilis TaxID=1537369 RepID=A0A916Z7P7_9BACT|nr:universal stress protein [Emticicia aquatilis]GGD80177.1 universal stress protein UspA [Emticicia aquatilis]